MQAMASALYELTDTKVGDLTGKLTAWRAEGKTLEDIAYELRSTYGVTVSIATLYRWTRDFAPSTPTEPEPAK